MSYDTSFKVKAEGVDAYVSVGCCDANITWNVREIIVKSTGLPWENCKNNGLCKDVIPQIIKGHQELIENGNAYKQYESPNGWGTVKDTIRFFARIIAAWEDFLRWHEELADVVTFWVE